MKPRLRRNQFARAGSLFWNAERGEQGFVLLDFCQWGQFARSSIGANNYDFFTRTRFIKEFGKVFLGVMQLVCGHKKMRRCKPLILASEM